MLLGPLPVQGKQAAQKLARPMLVRWLVIAVPRAVAALMVDAAARMAFAAVSSVNVPAAGMPAVPITEQLRQPAK